jgi:hypothetical protein
VGLQDRQHGDWPRLAKATRVPSDPCRFFLIPEVSGHFDTDQFWRRRSTLLSSGRGRRPTLQSCG